ncbi:MAG TPA: glycosyltransferase family 4 protein [candidate division Zixibacteria bacterium]|nr:glycosyltransferase family 4 protein [candidate division Zixibacteria bacterium]
MWTEAKTLRDAGWAVSVISPKGEGASSWHERLEGIDIYRYPLPTTAAGLLAHLAEYAVAVPATLLLAALVRLRGRVDVVHACNPPDLFFPIGRAFKRLGAAFIFDQHDLAPEIYLAQGGRRGGLLHRILLWCEQQTYRTADVVLATNESYRRIAIERANVDPQRVVVVRSSPDLARIHRVQPRRELKSEREHLVVYLGTMGPQDGVDMFLRAARVVADQRPGSVRFVAIGNGNQQAALRRLCVELGLQADVAFTGRIPDAEVREFLSTADVGVSPDPANGFNEFCTMNKTLEYMACGVPVVAFDLAETRVSAGNAAVYAEPNDPAALAAAILQLLDDPQRRLRMREEGLRRILGPLSWRASAESLIRAYSFAVGEAVPRGVDVQAVPISPESPIPVAMDRVAGDGDLSPAVRPPIHLPRSGHAADAKNASATPAGEPPGRRG